MDNRNTSLQPAFITPRREAILVLLLAVLAFGLRLHRLDLQPLWGDEGWSFYFASLNLAQMVNLTAEDIHPPLYYALLAGWLRLAGSTPEAARFLSILFGTLLVPLAYRVAARLFDGIAGLATAAVVTLSPFAIYYSQEVRMVGLVTLLGLGSVYFFSQQLVASRPPTADCSHPGLPRAGCGPPGRPQTAPADRSVRDFWGYILTTAAALYTMYYAAFIPIFQIIYFLLSTYRQRLRGLLAHPSIRSSSATSGDSLASTPQAGLMTHPFIRSLSAALLLYLPWLVYAGIRLVTYVQGKRIAEGYTPLDLPHFVASHLIAFSLGHLSDATYILAWATLLFLPIALLGLIYQSFPKRDLWARFTLSPRGTYPHRGPIPGGHASRFTFYALRPPRPSILLALYLLVPLLLGYLINRVYPFTPPYFERTLMLAAPGWWLLIGAGMAWLWRRSRPIMVGVGAALLLVQSVLLFDFYNTPRYQDQDYRPMLAYVRAHSSPEDVFLASYQWQVGFYYAYLPLPRPALYIVPGWGETWAADPARMRADLDALLSVHPRVWFPAYQALGRLWEAQAETYLNRSAFPAQIDWSLPNTKLLLYARGDRMKPAAAPFNFANRLLVERVEVGQAPVQAGRGILPLTLTWQKLGGLGSEHRVALRLTDAGGRTWASRDSLPQAGDASFTDLAVGERLVDHHGLAIPAGTPPGDYQLRLSVVDQMDDRSLDLLDAQAQPQGVEATLATFQVIPPETPLAPAALPVQYPGRFDFDRRARLLGYSLGSGPFRAGDPLSFSLFWQAMADGEEAYLVFAQLQDETGKPVALSETPPVYPSDRWSAGMLLRDPHDILLPATLPAGTYRLAVGLLRPDRSRLPVGSADQAVLTDVETIQRPHAFSSPSPQQPQAADFGARARLVGYDLRGGTDARPGQPLTLVLYWQALETFDRPYTVFAHLVDAQGRIVGQRDQVPGDGAFPTTSWVPGEYLADAYAIPIHPDTPAGDYWIEVGFYDPLDGTRLPVADAAGQPLGDRLLLEKSPVRVE